MGHNNENFGTIEELYALYKQYPNISTDTRKINQGDIFFALRGENFDGNKFAIKALESGAAIVVIDSEEIYLENQNSDYQKRMFLCKDSLETLQNLASYHRDRLQTTIIGISGTNGKTTTKELIHAVLSSKFSTQATVGNLNNHIGVPLTLLSIKEGTQIAIVEMGANHLGEIAFLCSIAKPDMGILTNVGTAHIEGFKSKENIIKTKRALFESVINNNKPNAHLFVNYDDEALRDVDFCKKTTYSLLKKSSENAISDSQNAVCVNYNAVSDSQNAVCVNYNAVSDSQNAVCAIYIEDIKIQSQLIGEYNAYNILASYAIGRHFGIEKDLIKEAIEQYKPSNQRSQILETSHNTLILDCYNANPSSCRAAIESLANIKAERKMVFMGAMRELGDASEEEHRRCVKLMKSKDFELIMLVGEEYKRFAGDGILWFETSSQMRQYLEENTISGGTILIKGSRTTKMEILEDVL